MEFKINETVAACKPSGIREFFDIAATKKDVISLGVGEPDFMTPYAIREEAIRVLQKGRTYYTSNSGLLELREAIKEYSREQFQLDYSVDEMIVTVGASQALDVALRTMLNPGDEVIFCEPAYVSYLPTIELTGAKPVAITLREEDNFVLTPELLLEAITEKSKMLFLNFPNNPTGAVMLRKHLEKLVPIIKKHHLLVLTDEIYSELTYGYQHVSIASLPGMKDYCIYVNGFSKAFAMTGWRLAYVCAPVYMIEEMKKVHQYTIMSAPTISQYAAVVALNEGLSEVAMMRESYDERRCFVLSRFKEMGLTCFEPKGAFYTFPCIKEFRMSSYDFCMDLLAKKNVAIVPGTAFGQAGEGFVRISYAYSIDSLRAALDLLKQYITELRHKMK